VQNGTLVRVMAWYDNEWGFFQPHADTAVAMGNCSDFVSSWLETRAKQRAPRHEERNLILRKRA